jgi:hypothetical protein
MKFIIAALAFTTLASAWCHDSITCAIGGSSACDLVCKRQGNPRGGRCAPRDGCPTNTICACYSMKRDDGVIDGDDGVKDMLAPIFSIFQKDEVEEVPEKRSEDMKVVDIAARDVERRSICCSLSDPWKGFCCESHCTYIGKLGGQCSKDNVCKCN